jgi:hypothetical protein
MEDVHLKTYLNDHLAACVTKIELARRCLSNNRSTELARTLEGALIFLQRDRQRMKLLLQRLQGSEDLVKQLGGWALEKVGRLKLNNSLFRYSDLSRVIELETLLVGIEASIKMWNGLERTRKDDPRFSDIRFAESRKEASDILEELEERHMEACLAAFGRKDPVRQTS